MSAYIILLNLPGNTLTIDGTEVEIQGGFRGFHSVPSGKHQISMVGYSQEKITLDMDLGSYEVDVRTYNHDTQTFEQAAPKTKENYSQLAASGAMGIALWPYPPSLKNITDSALIATILESAKRLKFLLGDRYKLSVTEIKAIGIGKGIISVRTPNKSLFFPITYGQQVLMPPVYGVSPVQAEWDSALWQNLLEIMDEYGDDEPQLWL